MTEIRALRSDEWIAFRELRLAALLDAPDSYRQTHADEASVPDDRWKTFVEQAVDDPVAGILVAADEERFVALAFVGLRSGSEVSIGGMWVHPNYRRLGCGARLLDAGLSWGRTRGAIRSRLAVTLGNESAMALYRSAGYRETGERETLREGFDAEIVWLERRI